MPYLADTMKPFYSNYPSIHGPNETYIFIISGWDACIIEIEAYMYVACFEEVYEI